MALQQVIFLAFTIALVSGQDAILFESLTAAELRSLILGQNPDLRALAAMTGSRIHIEITGPMQGVIVEEDVNANLDCYPWLSNFPGGSVQWLFQQRDENGVFTDNARSILEPPGTATVNVGGELLRWANITRTTVVSSAQDSTSGDYTCSVCIARGTPFQICHNATITVFVLGIPPSLVDVPETNICIERAPELATIFPLVCDSNVVATPTPQVTWVKDGVEIYTVAESVTPVFNMEFLMVNPNFADGVIVPPLLDIQQASGTLIFNTMVMNITTGVDAVNLANERLLVLDSVIGTYQCTISNVYGSDEITFMIRDCGDDPVLPGCDADTLFLQDQAVAPVGCSVCIAQQSSIDLNCSVTMGTDPMYSWIGPGVNTSSVVLENVNREGNYTCTVTNADLPEGVMRTTMVFFTPMGEISSEVTNVFGESLTGNGCDRLRRPIAGGETFDICVLVGETLTLTCLNSDTSEEIAVTYENRTMVAQPLVLTDQLLNFTVICEVVTETPCGNVTTMASVIVFDPAVVETGVDPPPGEIAVGQTSSPTEVTDGGSVTIICPTSGIDDPETVWTRTIINSNGRAEEIALDGDDDDITISERGESTSVLMISNFNASVDSGVYVCRTENIVGDDAAIVSLIGPEDPIWVTGDFTDCNINCADGVRVRSVTCRSSRDDRLLPNVRCTDARPASQVSCEDDFPEDCNLTPLFVVGEFGLCSRGCEGGFRQRDVTCTVPRTGKALEDFDCFPQQKPSVFESCQNTCCIDDEYKACKSIGSRLCNLNIYQQRCCWSCMLRAKP